MAFRAPSRGLPPDSGRATESASVAGDRRAELAACGAALLLVLGAGTHGGLESSLLVLLPLLPLAVPALGGRAGWWPAAWIVALLAGLVVAGGGGAAWPRAAWLAVASLLAAELTRRLERRASRANRTLAVHATKDHLTGLANRREFEDRLDIECRRSARSSSPLAVILLDVDHFKGFNDTYGHPHGDRCLVAVSWALSTCVRRAGDLLARFGGEEFVALLPDTGRAQALAIAESMRQAVRGMEIPHAGTPGGCLTISLGVTTGSGQRPDPAELLEDADGALYRAKAAGRDRVEEGLLEVSRPPLQAAAED